MNRLMEDKAKYDQCVTVASQFADLTRGQYEVVSSGVDGYLDPAAEFLWPALKGHKMTNDQESFTDVEGYDETPDVEDYIRRELNAGKTAQSALERFIQRVVIEQRYMETVVNDARSNPEVVSSGPFKHHLLPVLFPRKHDAPVQKLRGAAKAEAEEEGRAILLDARIQKTWDSLDNFRKAAFNTARSFKRPLEERKDWGYVSAKTQLDNAINEVRDYVPTPKPADDPRPGRPAGIKPDERERREQVQSAWKAFRAAVPDGKRALMRNFIPWCKANSHELPPGNEAELERLRDLPIPGK